MVANDNKYMTSAVESVYLTNEDRNAIKIAREREDYLRHEAYQKRQIKELTRDNKKLKNDIAEKDSALAEKDSALAVKDSALAEKDIALAEKSIALAEKDSIIAKLQAELDSLKNKS